jgi:hypothetical protein
MFFLTTSYFVAAQINGNKETTIEKNKVKH